MKKYLLLLLGLTAVACSDQLNEPEISIPTASSDQSNLPSKYISFDEAIEISTKALTDFALSDEDCSRSAAIGFTNGNVSLLKSPDCSRSSSDSTFYVVNFENGGAVLLAADRRVYNKIYGITTDGYFNPNPTPAQQIYLEWAYQDANSSIGDSIHGIYRAKEDPDKRPEIIKTINGITCVGKPIGETINYSAGVTGKTKWCQEEPYGFYAPNGYTGCVPLAVGQIMAYHKKPAAINGILLDWDQILFAPYHLFNDDLGAKTIAKLLYELGKLLETDYHEDPTYSATYSDKVPAVFRKLGYESSDLMTFSTHYCVEKIYGGPVPKPNAINPLEKPICGGPVYMRGDDDSDDEFGHTWVVEAFKETSTQYNYYRQDNNLLYCTEYEKDTYIYINWGAFKGYGNGYYKSPGTYNDKYTNTTYTHNFKAIYIK